MSRLEQVVIAYETEAAARARLTACGYDPDIAAEIAVYLAQSTDLPGFMPQIRAALAGERIACRFVELEELPAMLPALAEEAAESLLWCLTDGIRYYRGAAVAALARLIDLPRFGAPAPAQHLCQDKFASLALAVAAGLPCPPTLLLEDAATLAQLGTLPADGPYFVKPNTLGAKIGIFADSRCATRAEATARAARLWTRYADRALVQPFVAGADVRVSFLDLGGTLRDQLGIYRLHTDAAGETAGAFMTMQDNATLSGLSADRAFVPRMEDLRAAGAPAAAAVAAIEDAAERLARLLGLTDCFSMDFRLDAAGQPVFLEFEVCPAVTIHDFAAYLHGTHATTLGPALARAMRLAHARHGGRMAA